ncbi:MAG: AMP-binding protein [Deltaproteobacteria bacterium]|nr:AMP-binding protein [Deltaproteobacteria bacterium]
MPRYFANEELKGLSPEGIREYQERRLTPQLIHCYENSDFYRQKFQDCGADPRDIKTMDDLHALPIFMDKEQERLNAMESLERDGHPFGTHLCIDPRDIYMTATTSGTTGVPTFTYTLSKQDVETIAPALGHRFVFNGLQYGDRVLFIFALGIYATTISLFGLRSVGGVPIDVDARAGSELMLRFAEQTRPQYMATTVSLSEYLIGKAPSIIGKEVGELNLKGVFLTGEVGVSIPEVRQRIEEAYGCTIYDYWAPAAHDIAITCASPEYQGMHGVAPDLCTAFDDLVDPDTKKPVPIENGAVGEIVVTSLKRQAAPLVKYATGDVVQLWTEPCPYCGFPGHRIKLIGRADDMLVVKGVNIYPAAIKQIVETFTPEVTGEMRVVLDTKPPRVIPPLKLKLERSATVSDDDLEGLADRISRATHDQLKIRPVIQWAEPGSLEKSTRKTPLFEKNYE